MCSKKTFLLLAVFFKLCFGQMEKGSLTFVIDDTGFMGYNIFLKSVNYVFDTVMNSNASKIENFVLATFNVYGITHTFRTSDISTTARDDFKKELAEITIAGGVDCSKMARTARVIWNAVSMSKPGSYIYIFTDAWVRDLYKEKLEEVIHLAINRNCQISFILTGRCTSDHNVPLFQEYYKLAEATSGQVFRIDKGHVKEIKNYGLAGKTKTEFKRKGPTPIEVQLPKIEKPTIEKLPPVVHGERGKHKEIKCRILAGSPKPSVTWYFRTEDARLYKLKNETNEVLNIDNLDFRHSGLYQCYVSNDAGHDLGETTLIIDYPPHIEKGLVLIQSEHGERTTLRCDVHGKPKPSVTWFRNGEEIFKDREYCIYRDHSLRFKVSSKNSGKFTCVATNSYGTARKDVQVNYAGILV